MKNYVTGRMTGVSNTGMWTIAVWEQGRSKWARPHYLSGTEAR